MRRENAGREMPQEIEIKLRVKDVAELQRALRRLGAHAVPRKGARVHEINTLFDTPEKNLAGQEHLLRIRTETPEASKARHTENKPAQARVTFKRPVKRSNARQRHKVREEMETRVEDGDALAQIFEALGYRPWFRYEKFRTTLGLPKRKRWAKGLLIELDETSLGRFVELEGPPRAIDRAAGELGYSKRDYIVANYWDLYREECRQRGATPRNMVFRREK